MNLFEVDDKMNFYKSSYITIGSINRNCIKFLSPEKPGLPQCIGLGDTRGIMYVTHHKQEDPEVTKSQSFTREITTIDSSTFMNQERLFFSFGNSIYMTNQLIKPGITLKVNLN